ncbi:MAG: SoxR reducing system RseC family protein [Bacteroidales bacterium]|nr:SoxR reducing system RseC family protein [Candidatus Cryptobacteroides onthequi]MCQ2164423.1 SoxR reducing system RseC family protein [Bacteroidales bacterium]
MAKGEVSHTGRIVQVDPQFTTVAIVSESACASCHAAGLCGMSESQTKMVKVPTLPSEPFSPGEEVDVILKASMGHKAVWVAYAIPLFVMLAVIMGLLGAGISEPVSGLCGIASVLVYYFGVWLFRDRLQDGYVFTIRRK